MKFDFQNLTVYKKAKLFHQNAKELISDKKLTSYEKDQLSRASFSIVLNIAEGSKAQDDFLKKIDAISS